MSRPQDLPPRNPDIDATERSVKHLSDSLRERVHHALLAFLCDLGLVMTCLFALELQAFWPYALSTALGLLLVLSVYNPEKKRSLLIFVLPAGLLAYFLIFRDGVQTLLDVFLALSLTLTGVRGALPFFALPATVFLTVLFTLLSFAATARASGGLPAVMTAVLLLLLTWIMHRPALIPLITPTVIAAALACVRSEHASLSLRRTLPVLTALCILTFALVPQGGVSVEPLRNFSEQLRQKIMDYLFYTEPRNVFTLATEGWYPDGSSKLGGKPDPDPTPVMLVKSDVPVYLRGAIKNSYNGHAWSDTTGGRRYLWVAPRWLKTRADLFNEQLPQDTSSLLLTPLDISVQMLSPSASDLFVPQRVRDLASGGDIIPYFNSASEIFATRDLVPGDTWNVTAIITQAGEYGLDAILRQCRELGEDPAYASLLKTYGTLPSHLTSSSLFDTVHEVTQDAEDDYAAVLALIGYLRSTCTYTLDVESVPDGVDFVSYFLLDAREGYCTYFASAMTVLCRMLGLPARYVEGYYVSSPEIGWTRVTGENGHAWTEVYFPNYGWLTVDATPSENTSRTQETTVTTDANRPQSSPEPENQENGPVPSASPSPSPTPTVTPTPSPIPGEDGETDIPEIPSPAPPEAQEENAHTRSGGGPVFLLLLLLLLLALALRIRLTRPDARERRAASPQAKWLVYLQDTFESLAILGLVRQSDETPALFLERVSESIPESLLPAVAECTSAVFYGHYLPLAEDIQTAKALDASLLSSLKKTQRLRLTLRRAFLPLSRRSLLRVKA